MWNILRLIDEYGDEREREGEARALGKGAGESGSARMHADNANDLRQQIRQLLLALTETQPDD